MLISTILKGKLAGGKVKTQFIFFYKLLFINKSKKEEI
jgi:hypothetical protein